MYRTRALRHLSRSSSKPTIRHVFQQIRCHFSMKTMISNRGNGVFASGLVSMTHRSQRLQRHLPDTKKPTRSHCFRHYHHCSRSVGHNGSFGCSPESRVARSFEGGMDCLTLRHTSTYMHSGRTTCPPAAIDRTSILECITCTQAYCT
jgi:hypothetical protein